MTEVEARQIELEAESADLRVRLEIDSALNYALVHSGISPVKAVILENRSDSPMSGVDMEIALDGPVSGELADALRGRLPEIGPHERYELPARDLRFSFDPKTFASIEEAVSGNVRLRVTHRGGTLESASPIRLLARDEWWALSLRELLAAFVVPRSKAITELLGEASTLLAERTRDPSLQGYQGGADRAMRIAEAVYDAMRASEIRYINPPPSFEGTGQKIRSPHEVVRDRWGTCLDLACTYSAALEAAGLNPVIVLCDGHAFAGHLLEEQQLPEVVVRDRAVIDNHVQSGALIPVETTSLTQGESSLDFEKARARTHNDGWWTHNFEGIDGLIDVCAAHRRVRPLPAVHIEGGVKVVEVQSGSQAVVPTLTRPQQATTRSSARGGKRIEQEFPPRVSHWRNSLLDLSFRNPLLNMRSRRGALDLHVPKSALPTLEDLVFDGRPIDLLPHDELSNLHIERGFRSAQDIEAEELGAMLAKEKKIFAAVAQGSYASRLRGIKRKAQTIFEETGANNLFLTLGALQWEDAGRQAQAPLFLVPVQLIARRGRPFRIQIDEGGYAAPNQCLVEKLRVSKGLEIPLFENPEEDESGIDLAGSLQAIRVALIDEQLPFAVEERARLAILQFSTLQLWQDLTDNWKSFMRNPVVRHMVETPTDSFADPYGETEWGLPPATEVESYCPIPIDGSQLKAVKWAEAGRSFVLEGPPGTGKSQTITNLIANALGVGQRVLFVAEKQAALEVVRRRLEEIGLGPLCLDLHGKQQSPQEVRAQLREALHTAAEGNPESWDAMRSRQRVAAESLARYPHALHERGPSNLSIWTARQVLLTLGDEPAVAVDSAVINAQPDTDELYLRAQRLTDALVDLGAFVDRHPWSFSGLTAFQDGETRTTIEQCVGRLIGLHPAAAGVPEVEQLMRSTPGADSIGVVSQWMHDAVRMEEIPRSSTAIAAQTEERRAAVATARRKLASLREEATSRIAPFHPAALTTLDLDLLLIKAKAADGKLFKGRARKAILAETEASLSDPEKLDRKLLTPTLEALVEIRARGRSLRDEASEALGVALPDDWNPLLDGANAALDQRFNLLERTARLAELGPSSASALDGLAAKGIDAGSAEVAGSLAVAWSELLSRLDVASDRLESWLAERSVYEAIEQAAPAWQRDAANGSLVELGRWMAVQRELAGFGADGLGSLVDSVLSGRLSSEEIEPALRRGLAQAVIDAGLTTPPLAGFDGRSRDRSITQFSKGSSEMRREMVSELPAMIARRRPFDPERMIGKVGELSRELGRKRGGMKIRELFANYGPTITALSPCLMMSPHTAARFLPADAAEIDLVVFDEASQIRVAESICAMGRGKAVVVVGDSQQMPPSSAFGPAGEDDDGTFPVVGIPADMESILSEAAESNLPRVWLSWHYRSKHEGLIAFSNAHYYEGRLASFPRPPGDAGHLGISVRQINGVWERGGAAVNRAEAEAIVEEIGRRLASGEPPSIGVVTLNSTQRDLIMDMLEESSDEHVARALDLEEEEGLFVKNLENVQGDERDVVLFSLAFSPDPDTGQMRLNFGPLTQVGGERRLNVAITRARAQVILFASFEPRHIDLSRTSSLGMEHLRSYLEMAYRDEDQVGGITDARARDRHREEVVEALRSAGLEVQTEIGLSDFKIDIGAAPAPEGPWTAVLLDGPDYSSRKTVGDREILPQTVLTKSMKWAAIARIWLPDWLRDRDEAIERVVAQVRDAKPATEALVSATAAVAAGATTLDQDSKGHPSLDSRGSRGWPAREVHGDGKSAAEPSPSPTAFSRIAKFVPSREEVVGDRDDLDRLDFDGDARSAVAAQVQDVIAKEAPIEANRLAKIVARRFDLQRVAGPRADSILRLLSHNQIATSQYGMFIWPADTDREAWRDFRGADPAASRTIDEIAPEETINAMSYLARVGAGISREELLRETGQIFGVQRLTERISDLLESILDDAIARERLTEHDGIVVVDQASDS